MKKLVPSLSLVICFSLLISSCNLPMGTPSSTPVQDVVGTAAALTVQALSTQMAETAKPPQKPTNTLAPSASADTPEPSDTSRPVATWTQIPPTSTIGPLDKLGNVKDITYPDDTVVDPGTTFTKTWQLTNAGTTTWGPGYSVVFFNGDAMSSPAQIPITTSVAPNGTINVSVSLTSPTTPKSYTGFYKMRNPGGAIFGWGSNANQAFWVKITVGSPTEITFAVTSITTTVDDSSFTGDCPHEFTWTAKIKVNKAGTVTYHWDRSDSSSSSSETLTFSGAGTKTVTTTWNYGAKPNTYHDWERIYIDDPNHQAFPKVNITLKCTGP